MEWLMVSVIICAATAYLARRFYLTFAKNDKSACPACHKGCGDLANTRKQLETPAAAGRKNSVG